MYVMGLWFSFSLCDNFSFLQVQCLNTFTNSKLTPFAEVSQVATDNFLDCLS